MFHAFPPADRSGKQEDYKEWDFSLRKHLKPRSLQNLELLADCYLGSMRIIH
jgi:hypothetical protein